MAQISFGTDGWRGIIARDFTFANVERVATAIAAYLREAGLAARGVVVAYDNRFLADHFAAAAADVLRRWGIPVFFSEGALPTPVAAFAIKNHNAGGAVMLTASHNPPEYCGIKFIPEYAGPALPDITHRIEEFLAEPVAPPMVSPAPQQPLAPRADYFRHLLRLVDGEAIRRANLKVVVDPMYGAGIGYLEALLEQLGATVTPLHNRRDPLFGGGLPDPVAARLGELRELVLAKEAHLGLALDGDADRLGVIDADGVFISPNQILSLVCYHLLEKRGWRGPVVRTVATTHLVDRIAAAYGEVAYETPVGFKYIGAYLREHGCICGGEESGGLSIRGHVPEKDGILAGLLTAEIVATHGKSLGTLLADLGTRFGHLVSARVDYHTTPEEKERVRHLLKDFCPVEFNGATVVKRTTTDGVKIELANGAWFLIRASGTEPVFRVYAEAATPDAVTALHEAVRRELKLPAV